MNEALLQYIWKMGLYHPGDLYTLDGQAVTVVSGGEQNFNAGPDFLGARIRIGNTLWAGNVELHLKTSDWNKHGHGKDPGYANIILHVVLEHDVALPEMPFPTLALGKHIPGHVLTQYGVLMQSPEYIPCRNPLHHVSLLAWKLWLDRMVTERWEEKLMEWKKILTDGKNDWRQLLYYRLGANFGFHTNREPFLQLVRSIPLPVINKHRDNLIHTEAILFGQSGLLPAAPADEYSRELQVHYAFYRRKFNLQPINPALWKFMRMRPANFPTVRISQFAGLLHCSVDLFNKMMEIKKVHELYPMLDVAASTYWDNHYRFGEATAAARVKSLGRESVLNLLINTVAPMQHLYETRLGKVNQASDPINLLYSLPSEKNSSLKLWHDIGLTPENAAESQALLQLYTRYCREKRCLDCIVGRHLIK